MDIENAGTSHCVVEPLEPRTLLAGTQYTLTVDLFHDRNDNGLRNSNDPPLTGWKVHLEYFAVPDVPGSGVSGQRSLAATTDASGRAKFTFESSGTYGPQPRVKVLSPNRRWWNGRVDDRYDPGTRTYSYVFKASDI